MCCIISFRISIALLIFCLEDLLIDVSGLLKSPGIMMFLSVSHFMSATACFMYLGAHLLGVYMLMNIISSFCIEPFFFFSIWCPLSFFMAFALKSVLSDEYF